MREEQAKRGNQADLLKLFARMLVKGTRRLLRRGLDRGYLPHEDEIPGVRGKVLVPQTLRRNLFHYRRAACAWDVLVVVILFKKAAS